MAEQTNHGDCYAATRFDATVRLRQDGYAIVLHEDWEAMVRLLHAKGVQFRLRERTDQEIADAVEHNRRLSDRSEWRHADGSVRVDHMDARPDDYFGDKP